MKPAFLRITAAFWLRAPERQWTTISLFFCGASSAMRASSEAKCDVLYTEDLQHGQRFGDLVVTNPFA